MNREIVLAESAGVTVKGKDVLLYFANMCNGMSLDASQAMLMSDELKKRAEDADPSLKLNTGPVLPEYWFGMMVTRIGRFLDSRQAEKLKPEERARTVLNMMMHDQSNHFFVDVDSAGEIRN